VGHDNRTGSLEDFVQLRDEFAFFRSFHCLSPVDRVAHRSPAGFAFVTGIMLDPKQRLRILSLGVPG
jgi:hypothetical protein